MTSRCLVLARVLGVTIAGVVLTAAPVAAQAPSAASATETWTMPRTPWGDPSLEGIWTGSTNTPLERPARFADRKFLTQEEVAALEAEARAEQTTEREVEAGDPGTYNQIWFDPASGWVPDRRTSLIVEPENGRIPYTEAARTRQQAQPALREGGPFHSWLDVDTGERCIGDGLPMIWDGYNPNHRIVQTPGFVVIQHEMFRERRIIPIHDGPLWNIPQWNGESRGRWDGDTLVVEAANFVDKMNSMRWANTWRAPSKTMRMVERFTRVDADTIDYEVTIEDPAKFTRPWTAHIPLTANQAERGVTVGELYEYACHEGNYALPNVLRGARLEEQAAQQGSR